jgi:holo-ACP synthase/triphosphoribosyl-dephospho-CoA synthase
MNDAILAAREDRIRQVESILNQGYPTVLVLKANIPGTNKNISEAKIIVNIFKHLTRKQFTIHVESELGSKDGPYIIFGLRDTDANAIKKQCIEIEEQHDLGRFVDIDVFQNSFQSLSRLKMNLPNRKCFICDESVYYCIKSKKHDVETLVLHIKKQVFDYICHNIKSFIIDAMITELDLEYKFGLITKTSQGSHTDMNYDMMKSTIDVIEPFFQQMFGVGYKTREITSIFKQSREVGVKAEQAMFYHTNGINCYKGLIFVLGAAVTSLGYVLQNKLGFADIFHVVKELSITILDDFLGLTNTKGYDAYEKYHILGARGEVYHGLPSVQSILYNISDVNFLSDNELRELLRKLIVLCEDTVFLHRAQSLDHYVHMKHKFETLNIINIDEVKQLNQECIEKNLSFGGAADLLVTTLFLKKVECSLL